MNEIKREDFAFIDDAAAKTGLSKYAIRKLVKEGAVREVKLPVGKKRKQVYLPDIVQAMDPLASFIRQMAAQEAKSKPRKPETVHCEDCSNALSDKEVEAGDKICEHCLAAQFGPDEDEPTEKPTEKAEKPAEASTVTEKPKGKLFGIFQP